MLLWDLQHGEHLDWYLAEEAEGRPVRALRTRPTLMTHLGWVRDAYLYASNARPFVVDHGARYPGGIPPADIAAVLDLLGVRAAEDRADALYLIQRIDLAYLGWVEKRRQATTKKGRKR